MSNPTDTNQASEDELQRELERLYKCVVYDLIDDVDRKELWIKEVGVVVKRLIRTEKLKLLAEVRERVVGDNEDTQKWEDPIDRQVADECNQLRAEMRTILTKLEAEL